MADQNELFNTLADATGDGAAPTAVSGGGTGHGQGSHAYSFRDNSGNVIQPQLDSSNRLPVVLSGLGAKTSDQATVTPADSNDTTVVTLGSLTVSSTYILRLAMGASTKTVLWTVVQTDDATTTTIFSFMTGAGQFSGGIADSDCIEFTTGSTGTQQIQLIGNQIQGGSFSDMHGNLCIQIQ